MKYFLDMYKRYVDFSGRSTRTEFWCAYGIYIAIYVVLYIIAVVACGVNLTMPGAESAGTGVAGLVIMGIIVIFVFGSLIPLIAIQVRRLRDAGYAWWILLLCYVGNVLCGIGSIVLIVLLCMPTKEPENQY